jgi:hypothetical protein
VPNDDGACPPCDGKTVLFFSTTVEAIDEAKGLCAGCHMTGPCLETALAYPPARAFGVWAGTTPQERRAILRARAAEASA